MGEAMKGVTKAMGQMNRQMNLPSLQKIMQEFERQNEKMELVSEVMGDAIDDALEGDEEEEETEELVNQVLDEIGIDINSEVSCYHSYSGKSSYSLPEGEGVNVTILWIMMIDDTFLFVRRAAFECTCINLSRCTRNKEQGCSG